MAYRRELNFTKPMIEKMDMPIGFKLLNRKGSTFEVEENFDKENLMKVVVDLILENLKLKDLLRSTSTKTQRTEVQWW